MAKRTPKDNESIIQIRERHKQEIADALSALRDHNEAERRELNAQLDSVRYEHAQGVIETVLRAAFEHNDRGQSVRSQMAVTLAPMARYALDGDIHYALELAEKKKQPGTTGATLLAVPGPSKEGKSRPEVRLVLIADVSQILPQEGK